MLPSTWSPLVTGGNGSLFDLIGDKKNVNLDVSFPNPINIYLIERIAYPLIHSFKILCN